MEKTILIMGLIMKESIIHLTPTNLEFSCDQ